MNYNYFNFPIAILKDAFKTVNYDEVYYNEQLFKDIVLFSCYRYLKENSLSINSDNISKAENYYNIELSYSVNQFKTNGSELYYEYYCLSDKPAFVGIEKKMLFDFLDNDKSEQEIITLLMFLAIKSLIGNKACYKTNNNAVYSRMCGLKNSVKDLKELPDYIQKYTKRYQRGKIIKELENNWGLKYYSYYERGFHVSFKMDIDKLTKYATKKKANNKQNAIKKKKEKARQEALIEMLMED